MDYARKRMLVLGGPSKANAQTIGALRNQCDVIEVEITRVGTLRNVVTAA